MNKTVVQLRGQARAGVPPGTRLNDLYEVGEQIAQGGMGEIYRGHQIATGDPVALKMIKPEFAGDESVMALFHREASALNRLQHESIVRYYIFGTDRVINRTYLAMEFVEGSALSDIVARRPLSVEETTELRRRIAAGLQVAHDNGIIHRDISPDNIILPDENVRKAKIIDFGIARSTKPGQATVIGDGFAGKYNYVSPEQAGMFGGDVTARSDIYSLGLLLATCLLGKPIEMGGSMADVIEKRRTVPDLSGIDDQLRPLIARMLAPDPKDRPASMTEVSGWVWSPPPPSAKSAPKPAAAPSAGSKPPIAAIAAGLAVLVAGGIGAFMVMRPEAPPARPEQPAVLVPTPVPTPAPIPVVPPQALAVTPTPQPTPQPGRPVSASSHADRIINYVRFYDSDPCLYLRPVEVTDRSALIMAMASSPEAVRAFQSDFTVVNGFDAAITASRMMPQHCEAVSFVHQIDTRHDPSVTITLARNTIKAGERASLTISGAAGKSVTLLVVDEDGSVRDLSQKVRREGSSAAFDARLDEGTRGRPALKLLLALVSAQPLAALQAGAQQGQGTLFDKLAQDIRQKSLDVVVVPQLVNFE